MGKRSRKRSLETGPHVDPGGSGSTRAERDAARRERARLARGSEETRRPAPRPGRTSIDDRPKPLWHPFPLTEIVILGGIGLMVWGFLSAGGSQANKRVAAGLAIAALAGLELSVREHVTGFRSHTTLLAGAVGILTIVVLGLVAGVQVLGVLLLSGLAAFAASFYGLRELFRRRSGGLSFR